MTEKDDPILVKALLSHDPSWCCLYIGYHAALLFFTRLSMNLYNGMDIEQAREQFRDSLVRGTGALMAMDRDALVKVVLEAYQDNPRSEALDTIPADAFKSMVDNIVNEVKELRKVNGED